MRNRNPGMGTMGIQEWGNGDLGMGNRNNGNVGMGTSGIWEWGSENGEQESRNGPWDPRSCPPKTNPNPWDPGMLGAGQSLPYSQHSQHRIPSFPCNSQHSQQRAALARLSRWKNTPPIPCGAEHAPIPLFSPFFFFWEFQVQTLTVEQNTPPFPF